MHEELLKDIEVRITEIENRIESGQTVISQCKRQMKVLKNKLKEYHRLKTTVVTRIVGGCDGDL